MPKIAAKDKYHISLRCPECQEVQNFTLCINPARGDPRARKIVLCPVCLYIGVEHGGRVFPLERSKLQPCD